MSNIGYTFCYSGNTTHLPIMNTVTTISMDINLLNQQYNIGFSDLFVNFTNLQYLKNTNN